MRIGGAQFSNTVGSYASGKNPRVKTFSRLVFPGQKVNLDKERGWGDEPQAPSPRMTIFRRTRHVREREEEWVTGVGFLL
jgi:hypothetical protein